MIIINLSLLPFCCERVTQTYSTWEEMVGFFQQAVHTDACSPAKIQAHRNNVLAVLYAYMMLRNSYLLSHP